MIFSLHFNIMSVLFVFSLFLLLNVPNSCIAQKNYSSFVLIQQWPKGFCRMIGGFCTMKPNKFTIYGLWPLRPNGRPIKYCNTDSNLSEDVSIFQFVMVRMSLFYML